LIRASNFTFPAIPTLRPKLRKVLSVVRVFWTGISLN